MKKMWAVAAVGAVILFFVGNTLNPAGVFKSIHPHLEGTVPRIYSGVPGPEDFDLDDQRGLLFISSSDRWKLQNGQASDDGIYLLTADSRQDPRKLPTTFPGEFHPHGISLFQEDSLTILFVVNHNTAGNYIEKFEFKNDTLFHLQSLSDAMMCCPNDVVAVTAEKIYVTNDHGTTKGFKRTLEDYLRLPLSSLLYYDGTKFSEAYGGLRYGNGVNVSNDRTILYLAATTGRKLLTFDRDTSTGKLNLKSKLNLRTGVDNIDVDADGNLWIAAHPKLLAFVAHANDSLENSPSQVLKLTPDKATGTYSVEEVYMDDGSQLSGSSIAVRYKNDLFVGGVFERKILRIRLKRANP